MLILSSGMWINKVFFHLYLFTYLKEVIRSLSVSIAISTMNLIACIILILPISVASQDLSLMTFFGYPGPRQLVYGVATPSPIDPSPFYPPYQPGYAYCPPVYAQPVYPVYATYPVIGTPSMIYPQPYPQLYPRPSYPQPTTTTANYDTEPTPNNNNGDLRSGKQQSPYDPGNTYIPLKPGMIPGQQYAIPVIGTIEFTALTTNGVRIEGIAGSSRVEGLSKLRYYVTTALDLSVLKAIEVRWLPPRNARQSIYALNARRIFVSGLRFTDNGTYNSMALFSRCGRTTEMEPRKNYNFYRGCYKFAQADVGVYDYFRGSGMLCDDISPPIMDRRCIENEAVDYVALYGQPPITVAPPPAAQKRPRK